MAQPSPLSPAWQRAQALADSGDLAGARAVLERAVELGKVNLSEDDPDVLRTSYQLAGIHRLANDPSAARRVLEEAYAAGQWRLGNADPLMVEISHDIGVVAEELGNRHEARKAFGRVAEFGPSVLGAQHRAVARARAYLGQDQTPLVRPEAAPQTQPQAVPQLQPQALPPQIVPQSALPSQIVPTGQTTPAAAAAPSTPYDAPRQNWSPAEAPQHTAPPAQAHQPGWPAPEAPQQRQPLTEAPQQSRPAAGQEQRRPVADPPAVETSGGSSVPDPRTVQMGATPPVPDQRTAQMGATPAVDRTTNVFGAIPRPTGPGLVQPPSPANQHVWAGPDAEAGPPPNPIQEATVAHPVITPRTGSGSAATRISAHPDFFGSPAGLPEPLAVTVPYQQGPAQRPYEKRGMGLFAAIAAVLAAVIAVTALVFVLANRGGDQPGDPNVPTLGGKEPTSVRLRDEGSKIGITWQDPSAGTVSFMVAMGHPGEQLKPVATLGPGQTSYEMGALNTALNYCFTVIAVYRGNQFATSTQTCTDRPAPSTSK